MTTLNWSGPGSFHEAITATGPRIIVFRVAGVIQVPSYGASLSEANSYVTVAGQTSPGGITFVGAPDKFIGNYRTNFHDGVFRFLRFRGRGNYDCISFSHAHHLVFDHCDFSGAQDEAVDITHGHHVTIQWSTVANSEINQGGMGSLIAYSPTAGFSLHHNLYAHHGLRFFPHMHWGDGGVPATGATIEFSNNVGYNCADEAAMYLSGGAQNAEMLSFNFVANYIKSGPNTSGGAYGFALPDGCSRYAVDNAYPGHAVWSAWRDVTDLSERAAGPPVTYHNVNEVFDVVLNKAGAFPRDPMNERVVQEAITGTGQLNKLDDPFLTTSWAPPPDADLDGMPDDWETERNLDPNDPADSALDRDGDGYTNVEEYINGVAAFLIPD
ncbi:MAG: hypothetical protein ACYS0K_04510 [Planctomycetota bacterium]